MQFVIWVQLTFTKQSLTPNHNVVLKFHIYALVWKLLSLANACPECRIDSGFWYYCKNVVWQHTCVRTQKTTQPVNSTYSLSPFDLENRHRPYHVGSPVFRRQTLDRTPSFVSTDNYISYWIGSLLCIEQFVNLSCTIITAWINYSTDMSWWFTYNTSL